MFIRVAPCQNAPENGPLVLREFWQIFGKMGFGDNPPCEGKVRIAAYLLMILMVGLGGLEPPTSPLSVLRSLVPRLAVIPVT